eukprot:scaffold1189_cov71-Skeletonema_marinoi.AAC.3
MSPQKLLLEEPPLAQSSATASADFDDDGAGYNDSASEGGAPIMSVSLRGTICYPFAANYGIVSPQRKQYSFQNVVGNRILIIFEILFAFCGICSSCLADVGAVMGEAISKR